MPWKREPTVAKTSRGWIAPALLPLAVALATATVAACTPAPTPSPTPAVPAPQQARAGPSSDGPRQAQDAVLATPRTSKQGPVTIEARLAGAHPPGDTGPLRFTVVMDTHSVDLDAIDLAASALLRDDRGREVVPPAGRWEAPRGGHHAQGTLTFLGALPDGSPVHSADTKSLEMVIRNVGSVPERRLVWELASGAPAAGGS